MKGHRMDAWTMRDYLFDEYNVDCETLQDVHDEAGKIGYVWSNALQVFVEVGND